MCDKKSLEFEVYVKTICGRPHARLGVPAGQSQHGEE